MSKTSWNQARLAIPGCLLIYYEGREEERSKIMDFEHITITNNEAENQYEVKLDDKVAVLTYHRRGNQITFLHTGVPTELEGHGIASQLAKHGLDEAQQQHLKVIPACPYVAQYIRRHKEYLPLVAHSQA